jgi:hypothetical protein
MGRPTGPLPPCVPADKVKHFEQGATRYGPDLRCIVLDWRRGLMSSKWNRTAMMLLANEYMDLLETGQIKYNGTILRNGPQVDDVFLIRATIVRRLRRTQSYWKEANPPDDNILNDNDDDAMVPRPLPDQIAHDRLRTVRRRTRGSVVCVSCCLIYSMFVHVPTVTEKPEVRREEIL